MFQRDLTRQEVDALHDVMRSPGWDLLKEAIADRMASELVTLTRAETTDAERAWAGATFSTLEWVLTSPDEAVRENMSAEDTNA